MKKIIALSIMLICAVEAHTVTALLIQLIVALAPLALLSLERKFKAQKY
jgi:hypothetical protein